MPKTTHEFYMKKAINLAKKALGMTSPNPLVGAVVVRSNKIIGKGYHKKAGLPHGEIEAFQNTVSNGHKLKGATLYVTLEPCCHTGKRTPPCVDEIIKAGINNVVVGCRDQNPKVRGKGIRTLKRYGINVVEGVLEEECRLLNEAFFKHVTTRNPFVILKLAATLDGKIATKTGDSKWIGSESQRKKAHELRRQVDAVVVGIETLLIDNPSLNVRYGRGNKKDPTPIVVDSRLRTPTKSKIFSVHKSVMIATTRSAPKNRRKTLENSGATIIDVAKNKNNDVDLKKLFSKLGELGKMSVLIEGGSTVAASALHAKIVDKVVLFYSPKLMGGSGLPMIGDLGITIVKNSIALENMQVRKFGEEFMVEGYIAK